MPDRVTPRHLASGAGTTGEVGKYIGGVQRRTEGLGGRGRRPGGPVDRAVGLDLGARFACIRRDREREGTPGRHAVGGPPGPHGVRVRADGDEAGGGVLAVRRAGHRGAAPGIETEVRSALEAGSVAWWLLEPGLTARQRVCRMQLLRRNSAREYARSIDQVGDDPAVAGNETVAGIEAECHALGLFSFFPGGGKAEGHGGARAPT